MKIRKDMIFAVLTTLCMCALMFTVIPIRSGLPYDPWADLDDNGFIDIKDVSYVARLFGATGEAINKTALLLELQAKIDSLNSSLLNQEAYFETRITTQDALITELKSRVNSLEEQAGSAKTIRFCNTSELTEDQGIMTKVASFTLTPDNPTNNAIIDFDLYYEYKALPYVPPMHMSVYVNLLDETGAPGYGSVTYSVFDFGCCYLFVGFISLLLFVS